MQIFRHIPASLQPPCALAIGNFDGLHLGHQALLKQLIHVSREHGLISAVMTFEPHPREFFTPDLAPARLCALRDKLECFAAAGIERVYICAFNQRFAKITASDFMQYILRNALNAETILVGEDFRFGAKRAGSIADFTAENFNLMSMSQVTFEGARVSSTRVRSALAEGNLEEAAKLLGRHYSISGKVVEIKSDQFITFSVKETSGKKHDFILLNNFENAFLLTDKVLKTNDNVEVSYYQLEFFDAKLGKFISYSVITDIIKK